MLNLKALKLTPGAQMMFVSIVSFSLMHLCVKALPRIPVHEIISFRSILSLIVCIYVLRRDNIGLWGNHRLLLVMRGVVGVLSLLCFFYSLHHLPLATAVTISNLIPLFTLVLASIFLKEKIALSNWAFFLLSFLGVLMIKGFDHRVSYLDLAVALGAAFFTSCAHFAVRTLRTYDHPSVILFYFPFVSLVLIGPYTLFHWVQPTPHEWLLLLAVGVFTHIGQVYLTHAYANEEVSGITNIYYIGIVLSLGYGYFIFDEHYTWPAIAGLLLVILGVLLNLFTKGEGNSTK